MFVIDIPFLNLDKMYKTNQCYSWKFLRNGMYVVTYQNHSVKVQQNKQKFFFNCSEQEFFDIWYNYFDVGTDCQQIFIDIRNHVKKEVKQYELDIKKVIVRSRGVRLLNRDYFEALICEIFKTKNSVTNSIIQKHIREIAGTEHIQSMGDAGKVTWFEFPTPQQFIDNLDKLESIDILGKMLECATDFCDAILTDEFTFEELAKESYSYLIKYLMTFKHMTIRLAKRICLYVFHIDCFPDYHEVNKCMLNEFGISFEEFKNNICVSRFKHKKYFNIFLSYCYLKGSS